MSSRKTTLRELDHHFDEEPTTVGGDLRPWFARPAIWVAAIAAGGLIMLLFLLFLRAAPG